MRPCARLVRILVAPARTPLQKSTNLDGGSCVFNHSVWLAQSEKSRVTCTARACQACVAGSSVGGCVPRRVVYRAACALSVSIQWIEAPLPAAVRRVSAGRSPTERANCSGGAPWQACGLIMIRSRHGRRIFDLGTFWSKGQLWSDPCYAGRKMHSQSQGKVKV